MAKTLRNALLNRGFFPEVLPPCFTSKGLANAFGGLHKSLSKTKFHSGRSTEYIRYSGTKHNGSRRPYGTPNPISYYYIADFISDHYSYFENQFKKSKFSVSVPEVLEDTKERAIKIGSINGFDNLISERLKYSSFYLKADISQYFPNIYTHSLAWAAHGKLESQEDKKTDSKQNFFNELDFYIQQAQSRQTRGILVGPDAYRIVAEFLSCVIDDDLFNDAGDLIVGGVRYVDDYYFGTDTELSANRVRAKLEANLSQKELYLNDSKSAVESTRFLTRDDWAVRLRSHVDEIFGSSSQIESLLNDAYDASEELSSDSPFKLAVRLIDGEIWASSDYWKLLEGHFLRSLIHFPHALDYVLLIVTKRFVTGLDCDGKAWESVANICLKTALQYDFHHEICWLLWFMFVNKMEISVESLTTCWAHENAHISAMVWAAYGDGILGKIKRPKIPTILSTTGDQWLSSFEIRSHEVSGKAFGGELNSEFEHILAKGIKFIDYEASVEPFKKKAKRAISLQKYGYDSGPNDDEFDLDDEVKFDLDDDISF